MILKATETILKDGSVICEIDLGKNPEESAGEWAQRREALVNSLPNLVFKRVTDSEVSVLLQFFPSGETKEFNPNELTDEELLQEFGAVNSSQPGQVNKTSAKY